MGPRWRRCRTPSQSTPWKKGCSFTRAAPPLMFPRRRDRSTVQNCRIMSFASSLMAGCSGNTTGFSTILRRKGQRLRESHEEQPT